MNKRLLAFSVVLLSGCITLAPRSQKPGPGAMVLESVTAARWNDNQCAAGALSEVLNHYGDPVTAEQLNAWLPKARRGGVVAIDLLLAARERGFEARAVRGSPRRILDELARGVPSILMLRVFDAPGLDDDLFHYVVVSGADRERGLLRLHFGDSRHRWAKLQQIGAPWAAAGNAMFVVEKSSPRRAGEADLRRAVVLEGLGRHEEARALYESYLSAHPRSALAWTNLGNAHAALQQADLAEVAYRNALFLEPENVAALNNLAWLLYEQGLVRDAKPYALRAAEISDGPEVQQTLAAIEAAISSSGRGHNSATAIQKSP